MHIRSRIALLLLIICCCSCGSTESSERVIETVTYRSTTPGNAAPEYLYTETITIEGTAMKTERSGGTPVNSVICEVTLPPSHIARINDLILLANQPQISDRVSDTVLHDGGFSTLQIGTKVFTTGMVSGATGTQFHEFPPEAQNLTAYIEEVVVDSCGSRLVQ